MQRPGVGDEAYQAFNDPFMVLEKAWEDKVITPDEEPEVDWAMGQLKEDARPKILIATTTLSHIGQLAHVGVLRYPLKGQRRELKELIVMFACVVTRRKIS